MRTYLDHNATTPLRAEARRAMMDAMDVIGNPSSVHAEGRAAKMIIERGRAQVAELVGCKPQQVIFTSSATEAAALAVAQKSRHGGVFAALPTEHDCLGDWSELALPCLHNRAGEPQSSEAGLVQAGLVAISAANSETGVLRDNACVAGSGEGYSTICDITQLAGKAPVQYEDITPSYAILSAHKIGGPKGVGALINFTAEDPIPMLRGGGQEMNRRSGTENLIGIAGFGAAAAAAGADVTAGKWNDVAEIRNILEKAIEAAAQQTIFVGKGVQRLPNTSCFVTPGWKGETQVMQMDLAGFAVSAGSACSSGKVKASKVLQAMGYDETEAACAIRVSIGLETTENDVLRFAEAWAAKFEKHQMRAA
ncbi:cysteine desulfurase family protein [Sulfitobacter donghicola]|uniref:Cysteine desulfurase n=1 Tax=Sulfitobacter donghicola DSW-25 = KCTC 12864 = JCM 14565 TaxID=1300350 RepID=A0A073IG72_9RHOB|nr:aminotransferase class V-fold PLP-dependent enzyme [Sulfitobacter donghicola]KEJ88481.1 aminotransferase [Sulfitobacter donghicola DSW-25 = KCTC 12864 = JCM 14565]KIN69645.1 Cysteine desulfurase [Sulfitobacter donghicola DSW-25 = KCTC 12864 = JCM 14565]